MVGKNGSGNGIDTILFAIEKILEDLDPIQKTKPLSPIEFGKRMKGIDIHDRRHTLSQSEIQVYRNQLMTALEYWPSDSDWKVHEARGNKFKLVFKRKEEKDRGKR